MTIQNPKITKILKNITDTDKNIAMITAFRNNYSFQENVKRNIQLEAILKELAKVHKIGYSRISGEYQEEGTNTKQTEISYLIIDHKNNEISTELFKIIMIGLCNIFEQDSVLMSLDEEDDAYYYTKDGHKSESLGKFRIGNSENASSKIGNRAFKFEC
jgi:hypothetical protein